MANEIVEFKADNGALVTISADDVVKYLCPTATEKEVFMLLQLCKVHHLDPWTGDVYIIKYGDEPARIQAGKEAFTKRAAANPDFEGFEGGIVYADASGRINKRAGSAYYPSVGETLVGGWCNVYVKGKRPFYDEVPLQEYNTGRNLWKSKPATMIRKVALVHALREAFPNDFAGLYSEEEMSDGPQREQAAPQATQVAAKVEPVAAPASVTASPKQLEEMGDKIADLAAARGVSFNVAQDAVFGSKTLSAAGFTSLASITEEQAGAAIALLDRWIDAARKANAESATSAEDGEDDAPVYETE
jgi:phage recombination protein Bet